MENLYTQVRVSPFKKEGSKTVAMASILIADSFWLHKIRIVDGANGLFVDVPSAKRDKPDGTSEYEDYFHPSSKEAREQLNSTILTEYNKKIAVAA